jgi:hypothetical protein
MSPVPLTVMTPSRSTAPDALWCFSQSVWFISPPTGSLSHAPLPPPSTATLSKTPTAWVNRASVIEPPRPTFRSVRSPGEAAKRPTRTVSGSPSSVAVPTVCHRVPSTDSAPVIRSPERVRRSQRGDCAETPPAAPATSCS